MARRTKKIETTPEQRLAAWLASPRCRKDKWLSDVEGFEAGSDGYLTIGDENYERHHFDDDTFCVVCWTDEDGTVGPVRD